MHSEEETHGYGNPSTQLAHTPTNLIISNITYTKTMTKISTAAFCQGNLRQINCFKACKLERDKKEKKKNLVNNVKRH